MKKLILILSIILCIITFTSCCNTGNESQNYIESSNNDKRFEIVKINNHQYIVRDGLYQFGICHYEDCDFCSKQLNHTL